MSVLTRQTDDWLLWQLADSAFPTGGFAHSGGLEAAWQQGEVNSREGMASFIRTSLIQLGNSSIPFVAEAHREPDRLGELDLLCDRFLTNHVTNHASRSQGQALLVAVERTFPLPVLVGLRSTVLDRNLPGHLAPVFGVMTHHLKIDVDSAVRLFLFLALRGSIASAVRLGILGPMEGQALQFRLAPEAEGVASRCADIPTTKIAQTAPLLEIFHGAHDRLYSRLFQT